MASQKTVLTSGAKRRSKIPASWDKAFGILKGRKPDPLKELKKNRKEWEARMKAFEKRWRS